MVKEMWENTVRDEEEDDHKTIYWTYEEKKTRPLIVKEKWFTLSHTHAYAHDTSHGLTEI
jgi:hypothetical protein